MSFRDPSDTVAYRYAVISDIHLGHRQTPARDIIGRLDKYVSDELLASIDILVIAGDLYDSLLDQGQEEVDEIDLWILRILLRVKRFNVLFWILEGTPSHDRKQSRRILNFNEGAEFQANVLYVDTIMVHYEPRLDRYFLFVPDEMGTPEEVLAEVRRVIAEKKIDKVDCAFMHGAFRFQLPEIVTNVHQEQPYLDLVSFVISIGHVHEASSCDRIHPQGSFDRLAHGTEGAKGFNVVTVFKDNHHEVKFIENKEATIYKTVKIVTMDVEESIAIVDREVGKLPECSHVRLLMPADHPFFSSMREIINRYPLIYWVTKKEKVATRVVTDVKQRFVPVALNEQTLPQMVMQALVKRTDLTPVHLELADQFFLQV